MTYNKRQNPLLVQSPSLPDRDILDHYIDQIYESRWLTNNGQLVQKLEKELTQYLDVPYLVLTSNGTSALQLALKLYNIEKEVITTPFTFAATGQAISWVGAEPVFADIDPRSLCLDPEDVVKKIGPNTQAILPVNVYGRTAHNESLATLAKANGLKLIYDGAQSFSPPSLHQKTALNSGDATILSFHATKIFNTLEGGALILNNEADYIKAQSLINFGYENGEPQKHGTNAKMNEVEAAFGLANLSRISNEINHRKQLTNIYREQLSHLSQMGLIRLVKSPNYAYFPIQFTDEAMLLDVNTSLTEQNVFGRRYFYPLQPGCDPKQLPIANKVSKNAYCLPLHTSMSELDVCEICNIVQSTILDTYNLAARGY